jgi:hypothetical protein
VVPDAVQRYFDLVRPLFSGDRAYEQVAFVDQYFRWPETPGSTPAFTALRIF